MIELDPELGPEAVALFVPAPAWWQFDIDDRQVLIVIMFALAGVVLFKFGFDAVTTLRPVRTPPRR